MTKKILFVASLFVATAAVSAQPAGTDIKQKHSPTEPSGAGSKREHRIDVEKDKKGRDLNIRFLSPDGKTVRTLPAKPFKGMQISKSGRHLLYTPEQYIGDEADAKMAKEGHLNYDVSLYNAKGEEKWKKVFKVNPQYIDVDGESAYWDDGISDDGERSYVNYCDKDNSYALVVFDSSGKEIARAKHDLLLHDIEISPDGKLIGAVTQLASGDKSIKNFFFLDVDTGKTKLVRAERWKFVFASESQQLRGRIVLRFGGPGAGYRKVYKEFDALPVDLSELQSKESIKK